MNPVRSFISRGVVVIVLLGSNANSGQNSDKSQAVTKTTPPQVEYAVPGYFFPNSVDISSVQVRFNFPVTNVQAGDLKVNGSPAMRISGSGLGPYVFTGYLAPPPGKVEIVLNPGKIKGPPDRPRFGGFSWTVRLFDPLKDDDRDGLTNREEVYFNTDPLMVDKDGDGLPDPYELKHPCLSPIINEALPHNDFGVIHPGNDDADGDGVSNLEEHKRGTDPCVPDYPLNGKEEGRRKRPNKSLKPTNPAQGDR